MPARCPTSTLFPYTTLFRSIVRREWPHGVRVSLAQRVPVAAVKSQGKFVLLDADGVRVGESDALPKDLALAKVPDRKSTRLNSSHVAISYAVFCLKKKRQHN